MPPASISTQVKTEGVSPASQDSETHGGGDIKAEPETPQISREPEPPQQPTVGAIRRGWICVYKGQVPFNVFPLDYFVSKPSSWALKGFRHVFTPDPTAWSTPGYSLRPHSFSQEEKDELLISVAQAMVNCSASASVPVRPEVHFNDSNVYVSGLSEGQLVDLQQNPPVVRGKPMKLVERGLPFIDPDVRVFNDVEAMPMSRFRASFKQAYERYYAKDLKSHGLQAAFASYYEIQGLSDEHVTSGEVMLFCSGRDQGLLMLQPFFRPATKYQSNTCDLGYWHRDGRQNPDAGFRY
ncbi:uncharacterized protein SRS1_13413 [Sporisorium reilianum f. sp. reilianum]|uniref:Uncharacterized protein n=1 Tax=Sporisorium reilianum f. sp. reilianum TaxID=72559 RepID=A0A2N8UCA8_9BASI|nr:uncharacterized protein SRS1_13413 [Sporisorium reilianum f. sp. reilianum]